MTGSGTSSDPFIPSNWNELKTACETAGAVVSMPENGKWDMNDQHPEGAPNIAMNNCSVLGNGFTISKLFVNGINCITGYGTLENLNFEGCNIVNGTLFSIGDSGKTVFYGCGFSGDLNSSAFLRNWKRSTIPFTKCGLNFRLSGSSALVVESRNYYAAFNYCNIRLTGQTTHGDPVHIDLNAMSQLEGNLQGNSSRIYIGSGQYSKINIGLSGFTDISGNSNNNPVVVNSDIIDTATVGSKFIIATSDQLKDADWLTEHGFPCRKES